MHDIIPPNKRSIRNVPLRHKAAPPLERKHHITPEPEYNFDEEIFNQAEKKHSWFFYTAAIVIPILVVAIGLGFYSIKLSGAQVTVTPRSQEATISLSVDAVSNTSTSANALRYNIVSKTTNQNIEVTASGEERVEKKASGQIIIYNKQSTTPQQLIKNTRFQTPDGKIYRIANQVSVPGYTKKAGVIEAGSLEVTVYADVAGESYNIGMTDFTIPGFKGDPRFETMYARSKTAMTGGFVGVQKKVSEQDIAEKTRSMETELRKQIAEENKGEDIVTIPSAIFFEMKEISRSTATSGQAVSITYAVDSHTFVFPKKQLSDIIIDKTSFNELKVGAYVDDFSKIIIETRPALSPWKNNNVSLTLKGTVTVKWFYNKEKLAEDLVSVPRKEAQSVLLKYSGIKTAEFVISPFWKTAFPADAQKIRISE